MRWGWGLLKGTVSAQKALKGYSTDWRELLAGTEENGTPPKGGHWSGLKANQSYIWWKARLSQCPNLNKASPYGTIDWAPRRWMSLADSADLAVTSDSPKADIVWEFLQLFKVYSLTQLLLFSSNYTLNQFNLLVPPLKPKWLNQIRWNSPQASTLVNLDGY